MCCCKKWQNPFLIWLLKTHNAMLYPWKAKVKCQNFNLRLHICGLNLLGSLCGLRKSEKWKLKLPSTSPDLISPYNCSNERQRLHILFLLPSNALRYDWILLFVGSSQTRAWKSTPLQTQLTAVIRAAAGAHLAVSLMPLLITASPLNPRIPSGTESV